MMFFQVESAWLLMFKHISGFMSCGYSHPVEPRPKTVCEGTGTQMAETGTDTQTEIIGSSLDTLVNNS